MAKPLCSTAETTVLAQEERSHLNITLILGYCVGERFTLSVILSYGTSKLVKIPFFFDCEPPL